MKKCFFTVLLALAALSASAQSRGLKIAYLDMNYILDKVPDYAEAKNQLEQKASKWKQELEVKRNEIGKLRESLKQEKALLTKELIEEREEEIIFQETELLAYQEKRFGPTGDLITQKAVLVKPIQDQVFTVAQDLAALRNYDFVFDKSSDLTMLFAAKKHDISDLIIKRLSRAAKQEKLSSKEIKEFEKQEAKEELESNPDYADRQKVVEERKNAREKKLEERKALQEEKKKAYEAKRQQLLDEREARKNGTATPPKAATSETTKTATDKTAVAPKSNKDKETVPATETKETKTATPEKSAAATAAAEQRQATAQAAKEAREKKIEERKKLIEEKKQKMADDKEAARKAREEKTKGKDSATPATEETPAQEKPTE